MSKYVYQTAFDSTVTGNYAVAEVVLLVHTEVGATVSDKHVEFFETTFVEKHLDAFACGVFAFFVLLCDSLFATAQTSLFTFCDKLLDFFNLTAHW